MEVILLGTGGPRPDPRRMATTTLIRLGEENILFDAGRGVMVQLHKAGVPPVGRSKSPGYGHLKLPHLMIAVSAAEQQ
ncbi:hypothetical protein [Bradyrhizobium barranii]